MCMSIYRSEVKVLIVKHRTNRGNVNFSSFIGLFCWFFCCCCFAAIVSVSPVALPTLSLLMVLKLLYPPRARVGTRRQLSKSR